ncbi:FACT complex subunit (SPT16/CDC68) family protein [Cryptosporidium meleagridis]|uniref:FACT complex subunit n=1 Tax=Cryptosporidium meleagridis TaxID=93969 RepID=A0A2P4YYF7_9CRYT|nr:FACT complex subunit (SPT16/CDC68) family protein [Cryptosporidium meleagridis]
MGKDQVKLDVVSFGRRIQFLYSVWLEENTKYENKNVFKNLREMDLLYVLCGKGSSREEGVIYKSMTLHYWLFGFEFSDTLILFSRKRKILIVTSQKKVSILQQLLEGSSDNFPNINLILVERKGDLKESFENHKELISDIGEATTAIGRIEPAGLQDGQFASQCEELFSGDNLFSNKKTAIVTASIDYLLCHKDEVELGLCKKAAVLSVQMLKGVLLQRIETILDKELKESHKNIGRRAEAALDDKTIHNTWKTKYGLDPEDIDLVYSLVQSGSNFELKAVENSDEDLCLTSGCIILSIGSKYREYCANITRTYFLNSTEEQKSLYNYCLELMETLISRIKEGTSFSDLYSGIYQKIVEDKGTELAQKFVKIMGHCIGIEFRDPSLIISPRSSQDVLVQKGMTFNLSIGFNNLYSNGKKYAIWICDTVFLNQEGNVEVLTQGCSKRLEHVSYELDDEEPEEEKPAVKKEKASQVKKEKPTKKEFDESEEEFDDDETEEESEDDRRSKSKKDSNEIKKEKKSKEHLIIEDRLRRTTRRINNSEHSEELKEIENRQKELRKRKLVELQKRFGGKKEEKNDQKGDISDSEEDFFNSKLTSYKSVKEYPKERSSSRIYVDTAKESILVPIYGLLVPFHVRLLKNVVCTQEEGRKSFVLRINFLLPTGISLEQLPSTLKTPVFIKELMIRSEDGKTLNIIFRSIKELIKRFKQKGTIEEEMAEQDMIKNQQPIDFNRSKQRVILKDVGIRPTIGQGRRQHGILEAHNNGFRFSSSKGETIDILYTSIKHAIFQPVENDLIVILHLHLKHSIWLGKKKTQDIQFYSEVGNQIDDLEQRRGRNVYDPDEIMEEQRERETKKRYNLEYKKFIQGIEELSKNSFEAEIPYRDLGFYGVPGRAGVSNVQLFPTASCLVHLLEFPPFVLSLDEIEVVSFERVEQGLRNFDMIFVTKDYTKPVKRVDSIPIEYLDLIKRWLNEMEIVYYEGRQNLNWNAVLKTILSDIEDFVQNGGFNGFLGEDSDDEEGGSEDEDEDEDEEYSESDEDDDDDDDDDNDFSDLEEESSDDSFKELSSDEEEGLSWDELEKQAIKEDRKRGREQDEDRRVDSGYSRKRR